MSKRVFLGVSAGLLGSVLGLSAWAQPVVQDAGTFLHGQAVVIRGSDFGTKDPAAPALWVDGEDKQGGVEASVGDGWSSMRAGMWFYENELAGVPQPHTRSSVYVSAHHDPDCGGQACNNIELGFHAGAPSNRWFIFYYLRLHPDWGSPVPGYCDDKQGINENYKEMWQHEPCSPITGPITTSYYGGDESFSSTEPWHFGSSSGDICGTQINSEPFGGNPSQRWNHRMWVIGVDPGTMKIANLSDFSGNPHAIIERSCTQPLFASHPEDENEICHIDFGAYARYCWDNSTFVNMRRYLDDVYIDTTWARVLVGDADTPDGSTVLEPQPPTAWGNEGITVEANLGGLAGCSAYLFVYDAEGRVNPVGHPITICEAGDGGVGDATAADATAEPSEGGGTGGVGNDGSAGNAGAAGTPAASGSVQPAEEDAGCGCTLPGRGQGGPPSLFALPIH